MNNDKVELWCNFCAGPYKVEKEREHDGVCPRCQLLYYMWGEEWQKHIDDEKPPYKKV